MQADIARFNALEDSIGEPPLKTAILKASTTKPAQFLARNADTIYLGTFFVTIVGILATFAHG